MALVGSSVKVEELNFGTLVSYCGWYLNLTMDLRKHNKKMTAVSDMTPCNFVEVYRSFRGAYCLQYQNDE
jgi:hypothetical protein